MKKLKEFLKGKSREDFAKEIGTTKNYVNLLVTDQRRPSPGLALRIQEATGGQVTVWELLFPDKPICDPPQLMPQQPAAQDAA